MESTAGGPVKRIALRDPCSCGCNQGVITTKGGQDMVHCAWCKKFSFNASRVETGRERRSLSTRPNVRPGQRARILLRDNATCVLCHRHDADLDIGHLISVHDGRAVGMSDAELFSDDNLAAMCTTCNSGLSSQSLPPRLLAAAIWARSNRDRPPSATEGVS